MSKTTFFKPVAKALKDAGFEVVRNNSNHVIFQNGTRQNIVVPRKLEDKRIMRDLLRRAGL